jgi:hypothetical protein
LSRERQSILREWDLWIQTQLEARPSSASLDFATRGHDKWGIVHGWLLDAERLAGD